MTGFPHVYWQAWNADAIFLPEAEYQQQNPETVYAVLVFLYYGKKLVLANIKGRGLCIPSGRVEAQESTEQAAVREIWEETGAQVSLLHRIGCYRLMSRGNAPKNPERICPVFTAQALSFAPLPDHTESQAVLLVSPEDVSSLYFTWDPLIQAVFAYAEKQTQELLDRIEYPGKHLLAKAPN